jgi:flagellar biosynthesis protein FlhA
MQALAEARAAQEMSGRAGRAAGAAAAAADARALHARERPGMHVLAWNEIPDNRRVRVVAAVGR